MTHISETVCEYCGTKDVSLHLYCRDNANEYHDTCLGCFELLKEGTAGIRYMPCPANLTDAHLALLALRRSDVQ